MTTRQIWEIDDYNRIIDGTTKVLLFTVDTSSDDDPLPIMRKIAAAPAMYADAKQLCELVRDFMNDNRLYDGQVIQAISNLETALSQAEGRDK